jgi:phosphoribosylformimino-5-aminoimidazole carboxamide ribotide isomerase
MWAPGGQAHPRLALMDVLDMRIVPVLDLMQGIVVRGIGGRREEYKPIVSRLTASSLPVDVARAFRSHLGLTTLYLADLDAIAGAPPARVLYEELHRDGFDLWVDAGVRDAGMARRLALAGVASVVIGLETVRGPDELANACRDLGERVVFSLDLKGGRPLGEALGLTAHEIVTRAVDAGARRVLVLDLARVGSNSGPGTEELCRAVSARHPKLELAAGGGVRDVSDLRRLRACGVRTALVASALHDGTLSRYDLEQLGPPLDGR